MAARALLVGIDIYPDPRNNLNSCVADTLAFKSMLVNNYGFNPGDITLLHNQNATLANVRNGLDTLFAGAKPGDNLVFFESSHGYRFPDGNTMIEVLCLYDGFLRDDELVQRSRALPAGVLTAVLDACHAGGMNKLFFPGGEAQVARAKVWRPSEEDAEREASLYSQVSKFKFFGSAATDDTAAVVKNFVFQPAGVVATKDASAGAAELNAAMFAACKADETAAAGSPATNNLSAFTYAVTAEATSTITLRNLSDRVTTRLAGLNMRQTPRAVVPPAHPEWNDETFITMGSSGATGNGSSGAGGTGAPVIQPDVFDPWQWLRTQLGVAA
jgi:hypothetical protein